MEIKGNVKAISQHEGRYGINMNDTWFNAFGTCPVAKGDEVVINYEKKGDFNNIKSIRPDVEVVKVPSGLYIGHEPCPARKSVKGSAYEKDPVGLAVEVFCAMHTYAVSKAEVVDIKSIMKCSIDLVKQAQKAFS